jgi:hypothetical protein
MSARCEPPEELRGRFGVHWIVRRVEGRGDLTPILMEWEIHESVGEWRYSEICAEAGWRYLAPVATPAEVETLRAEVERLQEALIPLVAVIPDICDALDVDPDETSIRVRVDGGARDGEVLAERTLSDMLTVARAALTHKEPGNEG